MLGLASPSIGERRELSGLPAELEGSDGVIGSSSEVEERIFFGVVGSTRWLQRFLFVGVDGLDGLVWVDGLMGEVDGDGRNEMSRIRNARQSFLTMCPMTLAVTLTHDPLFGTGVFPHRLSLGKKQTTENSVDFERILEGSYTQVRSSKWRRSDLPVDSGFRSWTKPIIVTIGHHCVGKWLPYSSSLDTSPGCLWLKC
jgi:hypothetical protein